MILVPDIIRQYNNEHKLVIEEHYQCNIIERSIFKLLHSDNKRCGSASYILLFVDLIAILRECSFNTEKGMKTTELWKSRTVFCLAMNNLSLYVFINSTCQRTGGSLAMLSKVETAWRGRVTQPVRLVDSCAP